MIEDIQYYNKLGGMKKELSDLATKVFVMNQFSGRQNYAVMALIKLQSSGVMEDQILYLIKYLERNNSLIEATVKDITI